MKKLILLRGIPGCGKTEVAEDLFYSFASDIDVSMFSADDYFYLDDGTYDFDPDQLYRAHLSCQQNVEIELERESPNAKVILVHNPLVSTREVKVYEDLAKKYDADFISLVVENRHGSESVHNYPAATIEKMRAKFDVKL